MTEVSKGGGNATTENQTLIKDSLYEAGGIATFPAAAVPANNVSLAEVIRKIYDLVVAISSGDATLANQTAIIDSLYAAAGIVTFPAAAAPANGVSLAEVIREIYDLVAVLTPGGDATLANQTTIIAYVDELESRLTAARAGYLDELDFDLQGAIGAIPITAMRGTDSAALASDWTSVLATALANYTAVRAGYIDELAPANLPTDIATIIDALFNTGGIATFPAAAVPGDGVSLAEVVRKIYDLVNALASSDATLANQTTIINALFDTAGIVTFPSAAAPANGVSLAEVIREIYDQVNALTPGGDATAANQTTINDNVLLIPTTAMRGTDSAALAADWTTALAAALANYTAVRAGYLDELDFDLAAAIAAIPTTMVGTDNAALASVLGALTSAAATGDVTTSDLAMAYIKQLINNSLDAHVTGTVNVASDFTVETTLLEITPSSNIKDIKSIAIDLEKATTGFDAVATAGDVLTVYVKIKIDGTNYRQIAVNTYTAGSLATDGNIWIADVPSGYDVKVSAKVDTDRGTYDFPYSYILGTNA